MAVASKLVMYYFNPRSSCEERLEKNISDLVPYEFQSTLLMRGATIVLLPLLQLLLISIHAPHARSDLLAGLASAAA